MPCRQRAGSRGKSARRQLPDGNCRMEIAVWRSNRRTRSSVIKPIFFKDPVPCGAGSVLGKPEKSPVRRRTSVRIGPAFPAIGMLQSGGIWQSEDGTIRGRYPASRVRGRQTCGHGSADVAETADQQPGKDCRNDFRETARTEVPARFPGPYGRKGAASWETDYCRQ